MSDYTKATNFTAKDSLTTGDPSKIVLGAELDAEYSAIETAVNSKADEASPTFTGTVTIPNPADSSDTTVAASTAFVRNILPAGVIVPYGGSVAPDNWLLCDGQAVNRTTYAALFAVISTTYGVGDGATTFNVPNFLGRTVVGAGAGTTAETLANQSPSSNQVVVTSNTDKWITGTLVTISASTITGLANGTHYIIRVDATHISFASSLANAQNGVAEAISGTGVATITYNLTSRSLGVLGGTETHAMSSTELLGHNHNGPQVDIGAGGSGAGTDTAGADTYSTLATSGGNAAMNIMNPYGVASYIIKT